MTTSPPFADFTGIVLDGGRATRLGGRHKALLPAGDVTIAARTTSLFRELFADVLAVGDKPAAWEALGVRCVPDARPGLGPLAGLAAGLAACRTPYAFVAAGDMPSLAPEVVALVCRRASETGRAAVPRRGGRAEGLHAAYPADLAGRAASALDEGARRMTDLLALVPVTWIEDGELALLPGAAASFRNVNTPSDLSPG